MNNDNLKQNALIMRFEPLPPRKRKKVRIFTSQTSLDFTLQAMFQ